LPTADETHDEVSLSLEPFVEPIPDEAEVTEPSPLDLLIATHGRDKVAGAYRELFPKGSRGEGPLSEDEIVMLADELSSTKVNATRERGPGGSIPPGYEPLSPPLTPEDRESVEEDLEFQRWLLARHADTEPLPGSVADWSERWMLAQEVTRLERMLADDNLNIIDHGCLAAVLAGGDTWQRFMADAEQRLGLPWAEIKVLLDERHANRRYRLGVERGSRVTIYTGEDGEIIGSPPGQAHYLWVLVDGDTEPRILHPTWKLDVHAKAASSQPSTDAP
jgi:hypothetical protein